VVLTFEKSESNKKDRYYVPASSLHMLHNSRNLHISLPLREKQPECRYTTQTRRIDLLDLFFNPLLALLILFLECEIFDLGTASTIGGSSSNRDASPGIERYHAGVLSVERSIVDEGRDDRRNDWIWGRNGSVDRDVLAMRDSAAILMVIAIEGGENLREVMIRGVGRMNQDDSCSRLQSKQAPPKFVARYNMSLSAHTLLSTG
jgi:hypothetical protein